MSRRLAWVDFTWNIEPEAAPNPSMYVAFLTFDRVVYRYFSNCNTTDTIPNNKPCPGLPSLPT